MLKVRAKEIGFYGYYRNVDDEFEIKNEKEFSKRWMTLLSGKPAKVEEPVKSQAPAPKVEAAEVAEVGAEAPAEETSSPL